MRKWSRTPDIGHQLGIKIATKGNDLVELVRPYYKNTLISLLGQLNLYLCRESYKGTTHDKSTALFLVGIGQVSDRAQYLKAGVSIDIYSGSVIRTIEKTETRSGKYH